MKRRGQRQLKIERRPILPSWSSLPAECREEVLRLLAQMLQEHIRAVEEAPQAKKARDE